MAKFLVTLAIVFSAIIPTYANEEGSMENPEYLYKIVSPEQLAQSENILSLTEDDEEFIHFSREDQLDRILTKYWANTPAVVLKVDVSKLEGDLVYEANPGGTSKYFHLYDGQIPLNAVVESKVMN